MEQLKKAYSNYLNTLNIHVLRNVARRVGVYKPTGGKKNDLIERTIAVLLGIVAPVPPSNRGAPLKEDVLDPKYMEELERIRGEFALLGGEQGYANVLKVQSSEQSINATDDYNQPIYKGVLEVLDNGCGYLRIENCQITPKKDIFVPSRILLAWGLKEGDLVVGHAVKLPDNNNPTLIKVLSVNEAVEYRERKKFEEFSACYPQEKINLSENNNILSLRYIDLFSPIGKGQRVILTAPPAAGATTLLKEVATSIQQKIDDGENFHLLALLLDERPEEVTEFRRGIQAEVFFTTFDKEPQEHLRVAKLVFARAKRLAEMGEDVVVLLDSLSRLTYAADACVSSNKTYACGVDIGAFIFPRACLSQAVKLAGGGSITIIAAVSCDTGNEVDDLFLVEFEKICNARIALSRKMAERRMFPAFDLKNSYTRREADLLTDGELICATRSREISLKDNGEKIYALMKQTPDNAVFQRKILHK